MLYVKTVRMLNEFLKCKYMNIIISCIHLKKKSKIHQFDFFFCMEKFTDNTKIICTSPFVVMEEPIIYSSTDRTWSSVVRYVLYFTFCDWKYSPNKIKVFWASVWKFHCVFNVNDLVEFFSLKFVLMRRSKKTQSQSQYTRTL